MLWVILGVIVLVVVVRLLVEAASVCAGLAMLVLRRTFAYAVPGAIDAGASSADRPGSAHRASPFDESDEFGGSDEHPPFPDDR